MMRVVFFPIGDYIWASVRYRVYAVAEYMQKNGIETEIFPYLMPGTSSKIKRGLSHGVNFYKKLSQVLGTEERDIFFIHRGITPHGGPFLELLVKKLLKRKIIFDFDDTIFIPLKKSKVLTEPFRTDAIIKNSDMVLAGNHYLKDYAAQYNKNNFLIPTSINTKQYKPVKRKENERPIIGWIGSPTNLQYLKLLVSPVDKLSKKYDFEVRIIGANGHEDEVPRFKNLTLIPWKLDTDWQEVSRFDIGLMPLFDTGWGKGKCGFKALQCMTLGIPVVVSATGENNYIIQDGVNGFLCRDDDDWVQKIGQLIEEKNLRKKLGDCGRRTVEDKYDLEKNTKEIIEIMERLQ